MNDADFEKAFNDRDDWTKFIDDMLDARSNLIASTENDDEVLYLMMGSLGKLAHLFRNQDYTNPQIKEHCVAIASAAMCIALEEGDIPQNQGNTNTPIRSVKKADNKDVKFFIYKHDSDGMRERLNQWLDENSIRWDTLKSCKRDKNGMYMLGLFSNETGASAFVLCPSETVRSQCSSFLNR